LFEDAVADMRNASAPPTVMATANYNLACARVDQGRLDEALSLLEEALTIRPDMKDAAPKDPDLAPLYDNPRFQAAVRS
ncbi:MAG TPA: tetratricopeptide repeat protein, partial [Candidatus Dormibacteraeota bacterium]|nr:tetratricopeptide repeat protein [Candidatus Dormibacteraeota bacterium]